MKLFGSVVLLLVLGACSGEKTDSAASAPAQAQATTAEATTAATATAAQPTAGTASEPAEAAGDPVKGVWAGQLRIDAHEGVARLNYVGAESGDFVPMRFRTDSEVGTKILAQCGDEDLCEVDGTVRFLDEPPPENASAVGEIIAVERVRRLPAE